MKKHAAAIIAAVLLLLPALYVGSYLALVDPPDLATLVNRGFEGRSLYHRMGGAWVDSFYWPLQQIDGR